MPTYATAEDFTTTVPEAARPGEPAEVVALLERAERDVDSLLGPGPRYPDTGLKFDPAILPGYLRAALSRSVIAQAVHLHQGDEAIRRAQAALDAPSAVKSVEGPDFKKTYDTGGAAAASAALTPTGRWAPSLRSEIEPLRGLLPTVGRARP